MHSFPEIVSKYFGFMKGHGFVCATSSMSEVRYESIKVYIKITHEEREGEVAISFGRIDLKEDFSFTLFLRKKNPALETQMGERLAANLDQVTNCVRKLANALQREGTAILRGDDVLFDEMKDVRWWQFQPEALKKSSEHRPLD